MVELKDIREGSIVMMRPNFGTDSAVQVRVELVEEDIKNGRPGICYKDRWAYLHQVDSVVTY